MSEPNPDNPVAEFKLSFDDEEVTMKLEFHFSDNAEDFVDVALLVNIVSGQLLRALT